MKYKFKNDEAYKGLSFLNKMRVCYLMWRIRRDVSKALLKNPNITKETIIHEITLVFKKYDITIEGKI